jgi:hypothetical protein
LFSNLNDPERIALSNANALSGVQALAYHDVDNELKGKKSIEITFCTTIYFYRLSDLSHLKVF